MRTSKKIEKKVNLLKTTPKTIKMSTKSPTKFKWKRVAFRIQIAPSVFLTFMFKLFFKYWDNVLVFWMDDLLIYSQTEDEHLKHLQLVFEKFREAGIKCTMSKCKFFKNKIEYLGHFVWSSNIPMRQKIKAITDLAPMTNITEAKHMIS